MNEQGVKNLAGAFMIVTGGLLTGTIVTKLIIWLITGSWS